MEAMARTIRILGIVDDQPDIRLLLRVVLSSDPRVELGGEAGSAEEALEMAQSWNPDLIILDQSLDGDLTGIQAAPLFKKLLPNCKILLFSAYDLSHEWRAEPAIDGFLRKDHLPQLIPKIEELLQL